jgi:Methyl-accepting chemotaxis protein
MKLSIRTKLLIMMLSLMLASCALMVSLNYYFSQQYLSKSVDETATLLGTQYAGRIQATMEELVVQLEALADTKTMRAASDKQQIMEELASANKRIGKFDGMFFYNAEGEGFRHDGLPGNIKDREHFQKAISSKRAYISDPLISKSNGKLAVVIDVPVLDNGKVVGVITGTFAMEQVLNLLDAIKFKETGYGLLADNSGLVMGYPPKAEMVGKLNLSKKQINPELKTKSPDLDDRFLKFFATAQSGKQALGNYIGLDGDARLGIFTPIALAGEQQWVLVVNAPVAETSREAGMLTKIMLAISGGCLFFAAIIIVYLSRKFARPITAMKDEALLLAGGDLRVRQLSVHSNDELGLLATAFRDMAKTISGLIRNIHGQAESLSAASEELTASAQQSANAANQVAVSIAEIAQGTEKQASSATRITSVAEQMADNTRQVSAAAREISDIAAHTSRETDQGRQSVVQAIEQMNQIGKGSEAVQTAIAQLAKGSQEISEIVNLIATISGQTNLLALNAAIEAARAGEQGRGFAVVAEEVRKLAEQSNQATQQIDALIRQNQANMEQAVTATQAGTEGVKDGVAMVNSAGKTFKTIAEAVTNLSSQIKTIAESIDHVATSSQTLVASIHEIDEVSRASAAEAQTVSAATEEQSAAMEEIASSSQNLAKLAGDLQQAVAKFRV